MSLNAPLQQSNPIYSFNQQFIENAFAIRPWVVLPFNVAANQALAAGQIVGVQTIASRSEVQTLTLSAGANGVRTFQILVPLLNQLTAAILDGANAAAVQAALVAVVGAGNVVCAGTLAGGMTITFGGALANMPVGLLTLANVDSALTVKIARTTAGATNGNIVAYSGAVQAAPVAAAVLTDSAGAGTWPAGAYEVAYTYVNAQGETTLSPAVAYASAGTKKIHVAQLATLPAGVTALNFYLNGYFAVQKAVANSAVAAFDFDLADLNSGAPVPVPAPTTNTAFTAVDGSQVPIGALQQAVYTDLYGNLTLGTGPAVGFAAPNPQTVNVVLEGYLRTEQLTGLDANALKTLGRMVTGALAGPGVVHFR